MMPNESSTPVVLSTSGNGIAIPLHTKSSQEKRSTEGGGSPDHNSSHSINSQEICADCTRLNLEKVVLDAIENGLPDYDSVAIANVGTKYRDPSRTTACSLCELLSTSRVDPAEMDPVSLRFATDHDELRAFSFLKYGHLADNSSTKAAKQMQDSMFLGIVPSGSLLGPKAIGTHGSTYGYAAITYNDSVQRGFTSQIIPQTFNPDQIKEWFGYCKRYHRRLCSISNTEVKGLMLIDCESLCIEPAKNNDPYIALSYVWGPSVNSSATSIGNSSFQKQLPSVLPAVISDAIQATKDIGFRYLWVDKYCIDQNDVAVKLDQINQMDSIYENAELTIIAAAGLDENHGLIGVGSRTRQPQTSIKIGAVTITSTMKDPHISIRSSRWSSRGWTFQEGMLSRRRLVFTDEQVYFECNAMNCYESVSCPLDAMHINDKSKFRDFMRAGVFGRTERQQFGLFKTKNLGEVNIFLRYLSSIEQFTGRQLKFDDDSLRAFAGVMSMFTRLRKPFYQLWGIPFALGASSNTYFFDALCWRHKNSSWDGAESPRRRPGFPSWSWAGWAGEIEYPRRTYLSNSGFTSDLTVAALEFDSSRSITFPPPDVSPTSEFIISPPRIIQFQARIIPPKFFAYQENSKTWTVFDFPTEVSLSYGLDTQADLFGELKKSTSWHCVYVGSILQCIVGLIVEKHSGIYSRRGLVLIEGWHWDMEKIWAIKEAEETQIRIE